MLYFSTPFFSWLIKNWSIKLILNHINKIYILEAICVFQINPPYLNTIISFLQIRYVWILLIRKLVEMVMLLFTFESAWTTSVHFSLLLIFFKEVFYFVQLKCHQYWPNLGNKETYGTVSVKSMQEKHYAFYIVRKFQVFQKTVSDCLLHYFSFFYEKIK